MTDFDAHAAGFVADPHPHLNELRRQGPMLRHEQSGSWLATTHEAVSQTLRKRCLGRIWNDREPAGEMEPFSTLHRHQMMESEDHTHWSQANVHRYEQGVGEQTRKAAVDASQAFGDCVEAPRRPTWVLRGFERIDISLEEDS